MSLSRFVYYSAVIAGWAAFLAWMLAEMFVLHAGWVTKLAGVFSESMFSAEGEMAENVGPVGTLRTALVGGVVGAAIGAGLNIVSALANAQWKRQRRQLPYAILGGLIGGLFGGATGNVLYTVRCPQAFGWMIMGLAIGGTQGFFEQSSKKLRNGLIGGGLGGLIGGIFFSILAVAGSGMAARATGFVILGISIGALIGLTMVVLKEAWVTVVDGFRPGRELILSQTVTTLGRGDHLPLPLLGMSGRNLEAEHARITRTPRGDYILEDNHSRLGTILNNSPIEGPAPLGDGDLIRLGGNILRFHSRKGKKAKRVRVPDRVPPGTARQSPPAAGVAPHMPPSAAPPPQPMPNVPQSTPPAPSGGPPPLPGVQQPINPSIPQAPPPPGQLPMPGQVPMPDSQAPHMPPGQPSSPKSHPNIPPPPPPPPG